MKIRDRIILLLAIFGVVLFGVVHFMIIPENNKRAAEYAAAQLNPKTHDIENILKYKSKYMGNASNLINLFHSLPLSNFENKYQLYSDKLSVEISYKTSTKTLGEEKTIEAVYYDSTAAFALIDNLQEVHFHFENQDYTVTRSSAEAWFKEKKLSKLLDKEVWQKTVQGSLENSQYLSEWFFALTAQSRN